MKVLVALLLCSLATNAALFVRSRHHAAEAPSPTSTAVEAGTSSADQRAAETRETITALFDSAKTDGATLKARLEAAGFPPEAVRAAVMAQLQHDNRQRQLAVLGDQTLLPFWKPGLAPLGFAGGDPATEKELNRLRQALATQTRDLLGPQGIISSDAMMIYEQRWGPLPKEKIEMIQRISNDYAELQRELMAGRMSNSLNAEEQEKLALLLREQRSDLEAALTPEELFEYDLRTSRTASRLRIQIQAFNPTEEEYRAIFRIQHALDQASGRDANASGVAFTSTSQRNEERATVLQQLKGVLSEDRLADYDFATNPSNTNLVRITNRLGLPIETARQVANSRTQTMQEVAKVRSDKSLTSAERTERIAEVARATSEQISRTLGAEGFQAYLEYGGNWISSLTATNTRTTTPRTP